MPLTIDSIERFLRGFPGGLCYGEKTQSGKQ
jgi:hypothetical protein